MHDKFSSLRFKLAAYWRLTRSDKPVGTLLLLWPTLWALWLASEGVPEARVFWVFVLGVVLTRAAGCVMNDIADRHWDGQVARTRARPLVTGAVSVKEAWCIFAGCMLLAFALVCLLDKFTILMAFVALALAMLYPFSKRWWHGPQIVLGCAFGWAVPMVFMATQAQVPSLAWLLYALTVLWAVIYDTWYAITDRQDDLKIGLKSTAILFAQHDTKIIAALQGLFIVGLAFVGYLSGLTWPYYLSVGAAAWMMVYQQWIVYQARPGCTHQAFLNNQWVGAVIFIGIAFG